MSELLKQMKNEPTVWETAPDEIVRWASPVNYFRRTATKDFSIHNYKYAEFKSSRIFYSEIIKMLFE